MVQTTPKNRTSVADIFHNEITAWVVLAVSLILTVMGWYIANYYVEKRATERFNFQVEDARQRILKRMLDYEQVLRGGVALLDTLGHQPTRQQWHAYVRTLRIQTYFPGIQGIGLALMLKPDQLQAHIDAVRAEGFPDYTVRPPGKRAMYSSIVYLEPFDWRNQRAFGYDMYSNPMRHAAMDRARDSGEPSVSGRVILVQETKEDVQAGFLVYLPAYRTGAPIDTVAQRRAALIGYVYSPFRMDDLMRGILGTETPDVGFQLYDGTQRQSPDTLLYETNPEDITVGEAGQSVVTTIGLPGRTWTARFHSRPSFDRAMSSSQPVLIALGGVVVDLLLFTIIWSLAGERRRVQAKAEAMTADIRSVTQRLELAQQSAGLGTWDLDVRTQNLVWDERMYRMYDFTPDEFSGAFDSWQRRADPRDQAHTEELLRRAIDGGGEFNTDFRIVHRDGTVRIIEAHAIVVRDANGDPLRVVGVNLDVTERREAEERLRLAASVFTHAHEGIAITDANQQILEVNPTFLELTGFSRDEVLGQTPRILRSGHHGPEFYADMWAQINRHSYWRGEVWNRRKNGEVYAELLTISAVHDRDDNVSHYVGVFSDITALKQHQEQLERMAHYDALTQLPNRVLLADRLRQALARSARYGHMLAICYLDLDGFKPVNDQYGHDVGDQLLVKVGERLRQHLRDVDTVARLGGDEFVLLLSDLKDVNECEHTLTRLLEAMGASYTIGAHSVVVSASIGVALYPNDDVDTDTLLRHADQAMYRAKESGRNRYHVFDPDQNRQARAHREARSRVEAALESGELLLYYQPKVDMRHGRITGAEALIRWQHPERGLLPPREFLPVVEDSEFAIRLGDWVIDDALRQLAQWNEHGFTTRVSVNISARHLQHPGFAERLKYLFTRHPTVTPKQLELEVLETTALEDINGVSQVIEQCRNLGVAVALDDFGTGYSSLTYLKRLPADTLKVDQSFVRDMLHDSEDLAIIEGIVGLSQAFRRQVIAEGVESEEHGVLLLKLGCDHGQGYGIARPMPAEQLPQWARDYRQFDSWKEAGKHYWLREDLPLLTAELDHRLWVNDLVATLNAGARVVPPPPLDMERCRFGQWYRGAGAIRYGHLAPFTTLGVIHNQVHKLARELIDLQLADNPQAARDRIPELLGLRDRIGTALRELQHAMGREHGKSSV